MSHCYNCFREIRSEEPGPCPHCGYDPAGDRDKYPLALPHGSILAGQYIIGRVLGQGGFGITYLALDNRSGMKVAIKEYMPDGMAVRMPGTSQITAYTGQRQEDFQYGMERFLYEARVLAKFQDNPNIVGVRSYFEENGTAYFVMDYIEGESLKAYIKRQGGRISWQDSVRILVPVMEALAAVHQEGIIHRDVTPDNIFLPAGGQVKLLDFGSARYSLGEKSQSLDVILKAGYAPMEQYTRRGRQGPYTDVYSLAACFYAAITGYVPQESIDRLSEDDLALPSARGVRIPGAVEEAILHGLEVRAMDRFQSMEEFRAALDAAMGSSAEELPPLQPAVQSQTLYQPQAEVQSQSVIQSQAAVQPQPAVQPPEVQPPSPSSPRPKRAPKKLVIGAAALLTVVLVSVLVWRSISSPVGPTPDSDPNSGPGLNETLSVAGGISDADHFSYLHSPEDFIVAVPSYSDIMGMGDLFGADIVIPDWLAYDDSDERTQLFLDGVELYGEDHLIVYLAPTVQLFEQTIAAGFGQAVIMDYESAVECLFETDGSLKPEVRIFDWDKNAADAQTVPEVTGLPLPQADEILFDANIFSIVDYIAYDYTYDDNAPDGYVTEQSIQQTRDGRRLGLTVNRHPSSEQTVVVVPLGSDILSMDDLFERKIEYLSGDYREIPEEIAKLRGVSPSGVTFSEIRRALTDGVIDAAVMSRCYAAELFSDTEVRIFDWIQLSE